MNILVTGACGRFGPYIVKVLAEAGHDLTVFDRMKPGKDLAVQAAVCGELTCYDDCAKAAEAAEFDAVLHLAAQPWPTDHPKQQVRRESLRLPLNHGMAVNVLGTYNMLHAAMLAGIRRFVMTSSNCVMGQAFRITGSDLRVDRIPVDETQPSAIEDSYSLSKKMGEDMLEMYSRVYGMRTYALRCGGLFDEVARREIGKTFPPVEKWDWGMWGWVAREDAAVAHRLVLEQADTLAPHDVFLCTADDTFVREPSRTLVEKHRPDLLSKIHGAFAERASFFDNGKLKRAVAWTPRVRFDEYL